jgi:hypothetical protein
MLAVRSSVTSAFVCRLVKNARMGDFMAECMTVAAVLAVFISGTAAISYRLVFPSEFE